MREGFSQQGGVTLFFQPPYLVLGHLSFPGLPLPSLGVFCLFAFGSHLAVLRAYSWLCSGDTLELHGILGMQAHARQVPSSRSYGSKLRTGVSEGVR